MLGCVPYVDSHPLKNVPIDVGAHRKKDGLSMRREKSNNIDKVISKIGKEICPQTKHYEKHRHTSKRHCRRSEKCAEKGELLTKLITLVNVRKKAKCTPSQKHYTTPQSTARLTVNRGVKEILPMKTKMNEVVESTSFMSSMIFTESGIVNYDKNINRTTESYSIHSLEKYKNKPTNRKHSRRRKSDNIPTDSLDTHTQKHPKQGKEASKSKVRSKMPKNDIEKVKKLQKWITTEILEGRQHSKATEDRRRSNSNKNMTKVLKVDSKERKSKKKDAQEPKIVKKPTLEKKRSQVTTKVIFLDKMGNVKKYTYRPGKIVELEAKESLTLVTEKSAKISANPSITYPTILWPEKRTTESCKKHDVSMEQINEKIIPASKLFNKSSLHVELSSKNCLRKLFVTVIQDTARSVGFRNSIASFRSAEHIPIRYGKRVTQSKSVPYYPKINLPWNSYNDSGKKDMLFPFEGQTVLKEQEQTIKKPDVTVIKNETADCRSDIAPRRKIIRTRSEINSIAAFYRRYKRTSSLPPPKVVHSTEARKNSTLSLTSNPKKYSKTIPDDNDPKPQNPKQSNPKNNSENPTNSKKSTKTTNNNESIASTSAVKTSEECEKEFLESIARHIEYLKREQEIIKQNGNPHKSILMRSGLKKVSDAAKRKLRFSEHTTSKPIPTKSKSMLSSDDESDIEIESRKAGTSDDWRKIMNKYKNMELNVQKYENNIKELKKYQIVDESLPADAPKPKTSSRASNKELKKSQGKKFEEKGKSKTFSKVLKKLHTNTGSTVMEPVENGMFDKLEEIWRPKTASSNSLVDNLQKVFQRGALNESRTQNDAFRDLEKSGLNDHFDNLSKKLIDSLAELTTAPSDIKKKDLEQLIQNYNKEVTIEFFNIISTSTDKLVSSMLSLTESTGSNHDPGKSSKRDVHVDPISPDVYDVRPMRKRVRIKISRESQTNYKDDGATKFSQTDGPEIFQASSFSLIDNNNKEEEVVKESLTDIDKEILRLKLEDKKVKKQKVHEVSDVTITSRDSDSQRSILVVDSILLKKTRGATKRMLKQHLTRETATTPNSRYVEDRDRLLTELRERQLAGDPITEYQDAYSYLLDESENSLFPMNAEQSKSGPGVQMPSAMSMGAGSIGGNGSRKKFRPESIATSLYSIRPLSTTDSNLPAYLKHSEEDLQKDGSEMIMVESKDVIKPVSPLSRDPSCASTNVSDKDSDQILIAPVHSQKLLRVPTVQKITLVDNSDKLTDTEKFDLLLESLTVFKTVVATTPESEIYEVLPPGVQPPKPVLETAALDTLQTRSVSETSSPEELPLDSFKPTLDDEETSELIKAGNKTLCKTAATTSGITPLPTLPAVKAKSLHRNKSFASVMVKFSKTESLNASPIDGTLELSVLGTDQGTLERSVLGTDQGTSEKSFVGTDQGTSEKSFVGTSQRSSVGTDQGTSEGSFAMKVSQKTSLDVREPSRQFATLALVESMTTFATSQAKVVTDMEPEKDQTNSEVKKLCKCSDKQKILTEAILKKANCHCVKGREGKCACVSITERIQPIRVVCGHVDQAENDKDKCRCTPGEVRPAVGEERPHNKWESVIRHKMSLRQDMKAKLMEKKDEFSDIKRNTLAAQSRKELSIPVVSKGNIITQEVDSIVSFQELDINPETIGNCFRRGFRADNITLAGKDCLQQEASDKIQYIRSNMAVQSKQTVNFSERRTPLDFLIALGFSVDEASMALRNEVVKSRLNAAITEARVWSNYVSVPEGTLLYLLAYKAKPNTMRYFLQIVEAIVNNRIPDAVQLDSFIQLLDKLETGHLPMLLIFGTKLNLDEDDERVIQKQLQKLFVNMFNVAQEEAKLIGREFIQRDTQLLEHLTTYYRPGLYPHLELIAKYVGRGKLVSVVQLEAAIIYLSRLNTKQVEVEEFEKYCGMFVNE